MQLRALSSSRIPRRVPGKSSMDHATSAALTQWASTQWAHGWPYVCATLASNYVLWTLYLGMRHQYRVISAYFGRISGVESAHEHAPASVSNQPECDANGTWWAPVFDSSTGEVVGKKKTDAPLSRRPPTIATNTARVGRFTP